MIYVIVYEKKKKTCYLFDNGNFTAITFLLTNNFYDGGSGSFCRNFS